MTAAINPLGGSGSAVVTGAASGIGRAVAELLVARGTPVCLVDVAPMDALADTLATQGGQVVVCQGDVADPAVMAAAMDAAARLAPLTFAVLNAGVMSGASDLTTLPRDRYDQVVGVNVSGVVHGLTAFISTLGERPGAAVVTSSSVGLVPAPHDPIYAMTKHAVIGLTRSLALQPPLAHIKINCICPNGVDTQLIGEQFKRGRVLLSPEQVAERIVGLLDSETSGDAWVCTPTDFKRFEFAPNPGYTFPRFTASGDDEEAVAALV